MHENQEQVEFAPQYQVKLVSNHPHVENQEQVEFAPQNLNLLVCA